MKFRIEAEGTEIRVTIEPPGWAWLAILAPVLLLVGLVVALPW